MVITKDVLSGVLFVALGTGAVVVAQDYATGSSAQMGPGYFPIVIGSLIAILGLFQLIRALLRPQSSEPVLQWEIRPLSFLLIAVLIFAVAIDAFGLIPAVVALVLIGRLAAREGSLLELATMIVVLTTLSVGIFVYGLNMPLQLGPW
jgi:Tripartite tricarboxylate transporter TctB family